MLTSSKFLRAHQRRNNLVLSGGFRQARNSVVCRLEFLLLLIISNPSAIGIQQSRLRHQAHDPLVICYQLVVSRCGPYSQGFAILDDDEDCRTRSQGDKCSRDEAVLVPQIGDPWGDTVVLVSGLPVHNDLNLPIANSERHRVSNQDDRRDTVATQVIVAINQIIDADDQAHHTSRRQSAHSKDQTKPVHTVLGSNAPEDQ